MEFNLIIMARDLASLALVIGDRVCVKSISYVDENKTESTDNINVKINVETVKDAFKLGRMFQQKIKPLTESELSKID